MAPIFSNRPFLGKRLTCPVCHDSSWFDSADLRDLTVPIICGNHAEQVEMVDLATLLDIWGKAVVVVEETEIEYVGEVTRDTHPDDFESW